MYGFNYLVKGSSSTVNNPVDNMKFNGIYLNNLVTGYRQLAVGGRGLISRKVDITDVPLRSGSWFNYVQDEIREIIVQFQLIGSSSEDLRDKYAKLNKALKSDVPVPIQFDDEPEWTYYGIYKGSPINIENKLALVGEFTIVCPDPNKYKTTSSSNGVIPTLEAEYVYPRSIKATVTTTTTSISISNGTQVISLKGNYSTGQVLDITWGDEVTVTINGVNRLYELTQYSPLEFFKLSSGTKITGTNLTINKVEWRDSRQ